MTREAYLEIRPQFLDVERRFARKIGIIHNGEWDGSRVYNGDEVPLNVVSKRKQISKPNEPVSIVPPPIVGHNKYRDCTFVPFVSNDQLVFVSLLLFGGKTINGKEVAAYRRKYGKWLLIGANAKAYMLSHC